PAHFNPLGGVAVLASNTWAAMQGRKALKITWDDGPNADYDSAAFKATLEESARTAGKVVRNEGDFTAAAAGAARRHEAEYYIPHLAHATMEAPAATVRIANGKCDVWACVQSQGKPVAWLHRSVAPTIISTFNAEAKNEAPFELGMGVINVPFAIPNVRIENPEAAAHTRIGWFRSVSNIPHAFAVQSFVAELAHAMGRDPKDVLLEILGPPRVLDPTKFGAVKDFWNYGDPVETYPYDTGRMRRVIEM